jgi:putative transposase
LIKKEIRLIICCHAARAFFEKAIGSSGIPDKVNMDKSGANKAGIDTINFRLV